MYTAAQPIQTKNYDWNVGDDVYKKVMLMRNVRSLVLELKSLQERVKIVNQLVPGCVYGARYPELDNAEKMLEKAAIECGGTLETVIVDMGSFLEAFQGRAEALLKELEEDQFTAQELRNLGREVDV